MVSQTPLKDQGILRGLYKAVHLHQLILQINLLDKSAMFHEEV